MGDSEGNVASYFLPQDATDVPTLDSLVFLMYVFALFTVS